MTKFAFAAALALMACDKSPPAASGTPRPAPRNFELTCDAAETDKSATLFCTRIDTRNGDVRQVDLNRINQSNGPTASTAGPPGRYQLVCRSADSAAKADYRCVRLDTQSGELLLLKLLFLFHSLLHL